MGDALVAAGHEPVALNAQADVLLIDHDAPINGYRELIDAHKARGAKVVIYPHGANVQLQWDGIWEPHPGIDLCLTIAAGHKKIMTLYGYPHQIEVVGWFYSPMEKFAPRKGRRVLFAPMHPDGNNQLPEPERAANRRIFEGLMALEDRQSIKVRYLGSLAANGLEIRPEVTYKVARYDNSYQDILGADVVVTTGTFGFHAVALGVPMVTFWQELGTVEAQDGKPKHWELYAPSLLYPLDADRMDLQEAIEIAMSDDYPIQQWKRQFVGEAFDAARFVALIEGVVNGGA